MSGRVTYIRLLTNWQYRVQAKIGEPSEVDRFALGSVGVLKILSSVRHAQDIRSVAYLTWDK